MFYIIKGDVLLSYSDKKYDKECLETDIITQKELDEHPEKILIQDGVIVLNPEYPEIELQEAKEAKYNEANDKANLFLNTEALYELTEDFHVEATKENMNTLTSAASAIEKGFIEFQTWTSKEDNVLNLTEEQCMQIAFGIGAIQGDVWCRQYIAYKNAIEQAQTVEEVNNIVIDYSEEI